MLNEERVKHMVKLALYETKGGAEELKISCVHKKDYVSFGVFRSALWITAGYSALIVLLVLAFLKENITGLGGQQMAVVILAFTGIYLVVLIAYLLKANKYYKRKHIRAYHHMRAFREDLEELEIMYDKEEQDGKAV